MGRKRREKGLSQAQNSAASVSGIDASDDLVTPQTSHRELEARLRFALHQLGVRNAHHEFEHICRNITRLRICSNILTATGPVTSGGDQGRDFETFRTHLATQVKGAGTFVGLASTGPIVFACTVQKQKLPAKIRKDIAAIAKGAICKEIHYFLEDDLPIAKRHALQEFANSIHQIHLEIYDGAAIAEFLRDPDLFWIANEYLGIPADSYPKPPTVESWYRELRTKLPAQPESQLSYASFQEVKRATRSLRTHPERHADIDVWITCLGRFRSHPHRVLASMAIYEIAVVSLHVKGSWLGIESDIRNYFEHNINSDDLARLQDCACLVAYASTAVRLHATELTTQELTAFRSALRGRVQELLRTSSDINQKCILLDLLAFIELVPDLEAPSPVDVRSAFAIWNKMLALVDRAPLFPLQEFANLLAEWVVFLVDYEEYETLVAQTDALLAQRVSRTFVASSRMKRAKVLSEAGRYLQALHELNGARMEWFSDETLFMSLGCLIMAARHYAELGMVYAAKYYSLVAAYIALNQEDPNIKVFISRGLAMAAERDYETGSWLQALSLYRKTQITHSSFSTTDFQPDDPDRRRIVLYGSIIFGVSRKQPSILRDAVAKLVSDWQDYDTIEAHAAQAEEMFVREAAKTEGPNAEVFYRPPFSDCVNEQSIRWLGLGVEWEVRWTRGAIANVAAEQFVATAQILTCELARSDAYILPARVLVHLCVDENAASATIEKAPSNNESSWSLKVPVALTADRALEDMAAVVMVLQELSLKPSERAILNTLGGSGLQNAVAGNLYAKILSFFDEPPVLDSPVGLDSRFNSLRCKSSMHPELSWNSEIVDEYSDTEIKSVLERRYSRGLEFARFTLPRVLNDEHCRSALRDLRAAGWLDWQLIGAVVGIAQSWRAFSGGMGGMPASFEAVQARARQFAYKQESLDWDPVPLSEFTRERLEGQLVMNMIDSLRGVGLVSRSRTPDFAAIKTFVKHKMRYFDDDIPHRDLFDNSSTA